MPGTLLQNTIHGVAVGTESAKSDSGIVGTEYTALYEAGACRSPSARLWPSPRRTKGLKVTVEVDGVRSYSLGEVKVTGRTVSPWIWKKPQT